MAILLLFYREFFKVILKQPKTKITWPGPSAEMCRGFRCVNLGGVLPWIFLEDFLGTFYHPPPQKKKKNVIKSAKKSAAQNENSAKNPFCQNSTLKMSFWGLNHLERYLGKGRDHIALTPTLVIPEGLCLKLTDALLEQSGASNLCCSELCSLLPCILQQSRGQKLNTNIFL